MKFRTFGKTGWQVSEIGFGAWQIGGDFGQVDDHNSISTLLHAWESGVNFVDTAQMYGSGHSETVIGKALKEWSGHPIYIATKVQPVTWPDANDGNPEMVGRYPSDHVRTQCENSLKRLGVEAIDLYQLHGWFPKGVEQTEWYENLVQLQKEGKIRELGVSIRDYRPTDGIALAESDLISSQQVVYNIFEQRPADELLPTCKKHDVAVIARVPFDEGSLIGNWTPNTYKEFGERDIRRVYFGGDRFNKTYNKIEEIKAVVHKITGHQYETLAEVALRFCLTNPSVSVVIPGMKNHWEVDQNLRVSDGQGLPEELLDELKAFLWPRNYHTLYNENETD